MDPLPQFGSFKTVQTACEAAGVALNLLLLAFTFRHRVGTRLSTTMLKSQCVLDALVLIVDVLSHQYVLFDFPSASVSSLEWELYCSVVFSHLIYYMVLVMSVYNLVALSAERCLCLTLPFWYKRHGKRILAVCFGMVLVSPFLSKVPHGVLKHRPVMQDVERINGTRLQISMCTPFGLPHLANMLLELLNALIVWALPFAAMLALYAAILIAMRRTAAQSGQRETGKAASAAAKRLTIIIGVTSGLFVILLAPQTLLGVLYITGALPMEPTFFAMALFPFMSSINSAVNPVVFLALLPKFRRFIFCQTRTQPRPASANLGHTLTTSRREHSEGFDLPEIRLDRS